MGGVKSLKNASHAGDNPFAILMMHNRDLFGKSTKRSASVE